MHRRFVCRIVCAPFASRIALLLPAALLAAGFTVSDGVPAPHVVPALPDAQPRPPLPEATPDTGIAPGTTAQAETAPENPAELPPAEVPEAAEGAEGVEDIEPDALPFELADAMTGRQCSAWDEGTSALQGSFRADLGDGLKLWAIVCDGEGEAASHALFLDREEGAAYEPLLFADYSAAAGWIGTDRLFGISFEAGGRVLTSERAGTAERCGSTGTWVWTGSVFRLDLFSVEGTCGQGFGEDDMTVYERQE